MVGLGNIGYCHPDFVLHPFYGDSTPYSSLTRIPIQENTCFT
uniref:Uncharacterized protein n=1 Tax=Arundo donax TaxID=35708 RepID=A0A0A8Z1Z3_ARUDO